MMATTDLALRFDPAYEKISRRFHAHPNELADAFAGPGTSCSIATWPALALPRAVVAAPQLWQDPVPAVDHPLVAPDDIAALKKQILASGLSVAQLVSVAWRSASSFRGTDKRGGATAPASASPRRRTGRSTSPPSSTRCCGP